MVRLPHLTSSPRAERSCPRQVAATSRATFQQQARPQARVARRDLAAGPLPPLIHPAPRFAPEAPPPEERGGVVEVAPADPVRATATPRPLARQSHLATRSAHGRPADRVALRRAAAGPARTGDRVPGEPVSAAKTSTRTAAPEGRPGALLARVRPLLREAALVGALLAVYNVGRVLAAQRVAGAYDNAHGLWNVERRLRLPSEQALQSVVLAEPDLTRAANGYYAGVHFPLTVAVLVWLFLRRPGAYTWARRALVAATAAGLVVQVLLPTAPPRMLPDLGFVDTGLAYGQSVYGAVGEDMLSNQFAALPSLHVGWALLLAVVCIRTGRSRWRWLWTLHPTLTVLVVIVTGNHYWLDGVVGGALVLAALAAGAGAGRRPVPPAPPPPSPAPPRWSCCRCPRSLSAVPFERQDRSRPTGAARPAAVRLRRWAAPRPFRPPDAVGRLPTPAVGAARQDDPPSRPTSRPCSPPGNGTEPVAGWTW